MQRRTQMAGAPGAGTSVASAQMAGAVSDPSGPPMPDPPRTAGEPPGGGEGGAYDPVRRYNPEVEHQRIEDEQDVVHRKLLGFTDPLIRTAVRLIWLAAAGVVWVTLCALVLAIGHRLGLSLPLSVKAPAVILPPLTILVLLLVRRFIALQYRMRRLSFEMTLYAKEDVSRHLDVDRGTYSGFLESTKPKSVGALYQLLRLRMRGFRIWRRFHIHPLVLTHSLNSALKLPFVTPRLVVVGAPLLLVIVMVVFNMGLAVGNGHFADGWAPTPWDGAVELCKAFLGVHGDQALSAFPAGDTLLVLAGFGISAAAYGLAQHIRDYIYERLSSFVNTDDYMRPFTHDCSKQILKRYNYVREEMFRGYRRHYPAQAEEEDSQRRALVQHEALPADGSDDPQSDADQAALMASYLVASGAEPPLENGADPEAHERD